ncbi:MAG: ROK family protein, partial [Chloroflexi bacterium]|nr:ROK family protein [Chloroflexota bacterium]
MNPEPVTAIGIDVGGTKIAAGVVTLPSGQVNYPKTLPTRSERGGEAVLEDVASLAEALMAEAKAAGRLVRAIGVGLCELVDPTGRILSRHSVSWQEDKVRRRLAHLGPVTLEADVRAAAQAEAFFGAGRPYRIFLYLTIGTGISSCLMLDRSPYTGARGATGTMASGRLGVLCEQCGHISRQTLEQIASGPALVARFNQLKPGAAAASQDVLAAAEAGNRLAMAVVRSAGESLGSVVGWLVNVLDPEAVIVGGGLGLSEGLYRESFLAATRRHLWSEVHRDLPLLRAA